MASKTTSAKPIVIGESEVKTYKENRQNAMEREAAMGFEYALGKHATELEKKADRILQKIKELDLMQVYDKAPPRLDALGQSHPRFYGDHFLSNVALIEKTRLFRLCQEMPKGAHLHIHFNSNCHPSVLLGIAKNMKRMHIWSSKALINKEAFEQARIQFSILSEENVKIKNPAGRPDIFSKQYDSYPDRNGGSGWMSYADFRAQFPKAAGGIKGVESNVDTWLQKKVVFSEEEAHNSLQTAAGAWEKFNGRTQMMKGLFNYKSAYVKYIQKCLDEFAKDNIQYAEIRPNFMSTNHVWDDEGETKLNNEDIMKLIIEGYKKFQETHKEKVFKGLKVIYCTPRSFKNDDIKKALDECLKFKRDKDLGKYIAGFDLIGEEGNGKPFPLVHFAKEFLQFRATCQAVGEDIPFLFHCGETLENGTDTDRNLFDAVLLGAKRIGHGYALPWHPWVMKQMKEKDICVELCPISHEILGLTPRIGGHSAYTLLANNVACTISTDNGTPFRSTLSHDFYQIMAGKRDMTLFGFRQLIEWSIKHSCMDGKTKKSVHSDWEQMWKAFVNRIVAGEFGGTDHLTGGSTPNAQATTTKQTKNSSSSGAGASHGQSNNANANANANANSAQRSTHSTAPSGHASQVPHHGGPGSSAPQSASRTNNSSSASQRAGGGNTNNAATQTARTASAQNGRQSASGSTGTPRKSNNTSTGTAGQQSTGKHSTGKNPTGQPSTGQQ